MNEDQIHTYWKHIRANYPKLIAPFSLTETSIRIFRGKLAVLPGIIDTGFNRTLAINIDHINSRGILQNKLIPLLEGSDSHGRPYFTTNVNIWIYRSKYNYPEIQEHPVPELVEETTQIHVYIKEKGSKKIWPPMPTLGLEFFIGNNLNLAVDVKSKRFTISRHPR